MFARNFIEMLFTIILFIVIIRLFFSNYEYYPTDQPGQPEKPTSNLTLNDPMPTNPVATTTASFNILNDPMPTNPVAMTTASFNILNDPMATDPMATDPMATDPVATTTAPIVTTMPVYQQIDTRMLTVRGDAEFGGMARFGPAPVLYNGPVVFGGMDEKDKGIAIISDKNRGGVDFIAYSRYGPNPNETSRNKVLSMNMLGVNIPMMLTSDKITSNDLISTNMISTNMTSDNMTSKKLTSNDLISTNMTSNTLTSKKICVEGAWCDDNEWGHPVYLGCDYNSMVLDIANQRAIAPNRNNKTVQYQIKYLDPKSESAMKISNKLKRSDDKLGFRGYFNYNNTHMLKPTFFYLRSVYNGTYLGAYQPNGQVDGILMNFGSPVETLSQSCIWTYQNKKLICPEFNSQIDISELYIPQDPYTKPRIKMQPAKYPDTVQKDIFFMPVF